jgi:apolipoprotein N-acyltransferase
MGISAVIDGNGRVLAPQVGRQLKNARKDVEATVWVKDNDTPVEDLPMSRWHEFKKVPGVLTAVIPIDGRTSLYSHWGDWLPLGCWAIIGGGLLWVRLRRRRRAPLPCPAEGGA